MLHKNVLVLNQNYFPVNICNARRAIKLIYKDKAEILEQGKEVIYAAELSLPVPSVIRLTRFIKQPKIRLALNRRNILRRDNYTCQYCGDQPPVSELTIDHIIPRSRNGMDSWSNVVTACKSCNNIKADRTPVQAKMLLRSVPKDPSQNFAMILSWRLPNHTDDWKPYLAAFNI